MNVKLAHLLLRLYPRRWRARYGAELADMLVGGQSDLRTIANVAWSAMHEHWNPTPGLAMDNDGIASRFESWCVKAPWAMFVVAPMFLLAASYSIACLILWSGWNMFLPGTNTPFVRIDGLAGAYFGIGRLLYFGAPLLIGWVVGIVATRQRIKAVWPAVGLALLALFAATAQVQANRPANGAGQVSMTLAQSVASFPASLSHATVIFLVCALPALIWRLSRVRRA